jgi:hypothetical protein
MAKVTISVELDTTSTADLAAIDKISALVGALTNVSDSAEKATEAVSKFTKAAEESKKDLKIVKQHEAMPTKAPEPETEEPSITIKDLRDLVTKKVETHRDIIKFKLTEFGASNVSSLDVAKYEAFHAFLSAL